MRVLKIGLWAVLFAAATAGYARAADDVAELKKLDLERCKATTEQNIPALERLLREDYIHIHTSGGFQNKKEFLEGVRTNQREMLRGNDVTVRVYGDAAVMTGTQWNRAPAYGLLEMFITEVWVKENGAWKMQLFHATTKAKPTGPPPTRTTQ